MHGFNDRKPILEEIAKSRNSKVLMYVTGDRPGMETQVSPEVVDLFVDHLDELWPAAKISLVLYTPGGNTAAAWRIINLLRAFCDELEVIVPSKALSAGTLMCLGSDRIVMTKQAVLGPIDPSLNGPLNPSIPNTAHRASVSVEAIQGYLDVVQEQLGIKDSASLATVWNQLSEKIHPLVLGQIFRTRAQIRTLAKRLLVHQGIEDEKKEAVIDFLCSQSGSHDHSINRREARALGLRIENPTDAFYKTLKELHQSVSDTLQLRSPLDPAAELGGKQTVNYVYSRALIETAEHGSHQFMTTGTWEKVANAHTINDNRTFEGWRKEA